MSQGETGEALLSEEPVSERYNGTAHQGEARVGNGLEGLVGTPLSASRGNGSGPGDRSRGSSRGVRLIDVGPDASEVSHSEVVRMSDVPPNDAQRALDRFYRDLLHELGLFGMRPTATALGAAVVAKRVAKQHGISAADRLPLPRLSRGEREAGLEAVWRDSQ